MLLSKSKQRSACGQVSTYVLLFARATLRSGFFNWLADIGDNFLISQPLGAGEAFADLITISNITLEAFEQKIFREGRMASTLLTSCTISRGTEEEIQVLLMLMVTMMMMLIMAMIMIMMTVMMMMMMMIKAVMMMITTMAMMI